MAATPRTLEGMEAGGIVLEFVKRSDAEPGTGVGADLSAPAELATASAAASAASASCAHVGHPSFLGS